MLEREQERPFKTGLLYLVGFIFIGLPALIGYGALPLTNFTAEALCPVGLALIVVLLALERPTAEKLPRDTMLAMVAFALLVLAAAFQYVVLSMRQLDAYLVVIGMLTCVIVAVWSGYEAAAGGRSERWAASIAGCLGFAAILAALASCAQYLGVDARVVLVSPVSDAGRTYGFFRQPNHQGTFLNMGLAAVFYLQSSGRLKTWLWVAVTLLLVFAIATTGSRTALLQTGFMGLCTLALPGTSLKGKVRNLWPAFAIAAVWILLYVAAQHGGANFYGAQKLDQTMTEGVGMRSAAWRQTLVMLGEHPWRGVGILRYPAAFFLSGSGVVVGLNMGHSHNLLLQLAIDFGLPVAVLFLTLLAYLVWRIRNNAFSNSGFMAAMVLSCLLIHSLVEFPLWYTYFLIPAGWFLGWLTHTPALMQVDDGCGKPVSEGGQRLRQALRLLLATIMLSTVVKMNNDYFLLTPAFTPGPASEQVRSVGEMQRVFWFHRFAEFAKLQVEPLSVADATTYAGRAADIGCMMNEIWYQTRTIAMLAQAGYVDDAKWILYMISRMTKNGDLGSYRSALAGYPLPAANALVNYIDDIQPVPRSTRLYDQICGEQ
jgi:Virulence factor membrane-bound polymerase, C-terminal/O-Antigen ligase/Protein glycosylation ligase